MLTLAVPEDAAALMSLFSRAFADYAHRMGRAKAGPFDWLAGVVARKQIWWFEERRGAVYLREEGSTLHIEQIAVDPDHQKNGSGRAILEVIEAEARARGLDEIALYTAQQMTHLVAFYSKCGFCVVGVGPHPRGRDDRLRVFMSKSLV